jgi:hypothetical protein
MTALIRRKDGTFFIEEEGGAYVWGGKRRARRCSQADLDHWLPILRFHFGPCDVVEVA